MKSLLIELPQGSPEWHAWRKEGIGASDAPSIQGVSPYKTKLELYNEKRGAAVTAEDDSQEFIFAKGHRTEALIRKEFQELVRDEIKPCCYQHGTHSYLRASLDGFSETHGVLEAKLVGKDVLETALTTGDIPLHHYVQMQHQFFVCGADRGQWFGHNGKNQGALIPIEADKEFMQKLLADEQAFWVDLIEGNVPPLSERDYLIPEDEALLKELFEAKVQKENAEAYFEELKAKAAATYKHGRIAGAGIRLMKVRKQGALSLGDVPEISKAIEETKSKLKPEYLETFRKKGSESWQVHVESLKKAK